MAASKKKVGKKSTPAKTAAKKPAASAKSKTVKKVAASAKTGATSRPQSSKGKPKAIKASSATKPAAQANAPGKRSSAAAASQPERPARPVVLAGSGGRQVLGGASLGGNAFASQTAGKWTMKPPTKPEGFGKAVAQMTSNTRMANEAPFALGRGNTDFARTASATIAGHRGATDRRMQSKRDAKATGSGD